MRNHNMAARATLTKPADSGNSQRSALARRPDVVLWSHGSTLSWPGRSAR
jgi:hypothetical protein